MSPSLQQLAHQAMKLTPEERIELAEKLWLSVDTLEKIEAAWNAEIERRVAQLDAGEVGTVFVDEVIAELRAKLR